MKTKNVIWLCIFVFIVSFSVYFFIDAIVIRGEMIRKDVEVRLVNTVSEDGEHAWEFLINNKEIPAGEKIAVFYDNFPISLREFYSRKITDKVNIGDLIREDGDIITYRYFSSINGEEKLFIEIQHNDGTVNWISLNIY